jgi:transposase
MNKFLTPEKIEELKLSHKKERDKRICDRIKAVLLWDDGYTHTEISKILLLDETSIRRHIEEYISENKLNNNHLGSVCKLTVNQSEELIQYLSENTYINVKPIINYVQDKYSVTYSKSGMTTWLKANKFSYKKPNIVPSKVNIEAQAKFIKVMEEIKASGELLFYSDAVHPTHQSRVSHGWIRKGSNISIQSNTGRDRVNIAGIIEIDSKQMIYEEGDKINSQLMIKLFDKLISIYGRKLRLNIVLDNAKYQKSFLIEEYLKDNQNIILHYLPAYSPNLNLIERVWKFMHKTVTNNQYYVHFKDFKHSILSFFSTFESYKNDIEKLLTFKFQRLDFTIGKFAK